MEILRRTTSAILALILVAEMLPVPPAEATEETTVQTETVSEALIPFEETAVTEPETTVPEETGAETQEPETLPVKTTAVMPEATAVSEEAEVVLSEPGTLEYSYSVDASTGTVAITGYTGTAVEVVVPAQLDGHPVTAIGEKAFQNAALLVSVVLPEGLLQIGKNAFEGCKLLESVVLPDSVTTIGYRAFAECTSLSSINYPLSWTNTIANGGWNGGIFYNCTSLTSMTVPEGVEEIPAHAFSSANTLQEIRLPESLTKIGEQAFSGCTALTAINIPESVTVIPKWAFENCKALEKLELPDSITTIGYHAFAECTSLSSINYPLSWTNTIANGSWNGGIFYNCTSLLEMTIPEGVEEIAPHAFESANCLQKITLPQSLTTLGTGAFAGCTALTEVTLPESVAMIHDRAFSNCSTLVKINIPEAVTVIPRWAFENCKALTHLELPDGITAIGYHAFAECTSLSSINFPRNWTNTIANGGWNGGIFYNCTSLTSITVPEGVEEIPAHAFSSANTLQEIRLPESLTKIGEQAFSGCTALTAINIPESVTVIPKWAFENCKALEKLELPDSITTIGYHAFAECTSLSSINYPLSWTNTIANGGWNGGIFYNCTSLLEMTIPEGVEEIAPHAFESANCLQKITLPHSLTTLGTGAFAGCTALTEVTLPESVATIHDQAFSNCSTLVKINIPEAVTVIPRWAFENCKALTHLELPDGITAIGYHAFAECTSLSSINFPQNWTNTIANGGWNGGIFYNCTSLTSMTVPEGVEEIPAHAFSSANTLQEIRLPESLTKIGEQAFSGCTALTAINIPESVTVIPKWAFENCKALEKLELPDGITAIGYHAFAECTSLSSINYPLSWTNTIANGGWNGGIFYNCTSLTSMTVPEGVEEIPAHAFSSANTLQEIRLPESLTKIGEKAFADCNALTKLVLPQGVTGIPNYAFQNCGQLTTLQIPEGVTTIGKGAFQGCGSLTRLGIPSSVTAIGSGCFQGAGDVVIYCTYNSYATLYAIENNLLFVNTDEFEDSQQYALEKEACRYYAEVKAITAGGYVSLGVQYAIKDSWKDRVSDLQLQLVLPQNIDLDEFTLKLGGQICTDYSFDNNRVLHIPVTEPEGKLTFSVKMNGQTGLFSYAALSVKKDGTQVKEIIGILNEEVNVLTLEAPQMVGSQEIALSGIAPLSAEVSLAVNGTVQKTVTASKAGNWSATVTISDPKDCETYRITAQCDGLKQETEVTYRIQEPELTGFEMYYNEHNKIKECDLMDSTGTKPKVYFLPGTQFDFQVTFDHPEKIDKVYVSSTRNQEIKYLEAKYDAEKGAFITDGFFDSDNKNYVPGSLRVEYTKKTETVKVSDTFDWEVFDDQLSENAVEYTQATQTQLSGLVDLGSVFEDLSGVIVDASISCYDEETDGDLADWLGAFSDVDTLASYTVPGYNGEKYLLTMDYSDPGNWLMLVHDITGNQYIKLSLKNAMDSAETLEKFGKLQTVSNTLSTVNTVAGMLLKQHEISTDMDQLREDVMRTSYATSEERTAALKQVDALESDQSWFYLITAVIPLVAISAPAAAGAAVMAGPAIMLTAMLGVFGAMAPMFFDMRAGMIKGQSYRVNFVIDPSGYVYDNVTNARLEGVTASAYWIPYDESEDFWNKVPDAAEYGTLWNAGEYDQENPLLTNADGKYAWDVPEGWWRVRYEKDGYETTWSEWLPVPPPQTEVNIGMTPTGHSFSLGDVNHDGKINAKDATLILQKSVGVLKDSAKFCETCAEVSGDGKLNAKDSTLILQFSVGLRDSFPAMK